MLYAFEDACRAHASADAHGDHAVLELGIALEGMHQRGRADGEVLGLLRQGLVKATRAKAVEEIRGEFPAIDLALSRLNRPSDWWEGSQLHP